MQNSGTAIRNAAAQVRDILLNEAAKRFNVSVETLSADKRMISGGDAGSVSYAELVSSVELHVEAQPQSNLTKPENLRVIGKPVPRVDIPAKVTGGVAYVQDIRMKGMLHARVIRPPSEGATLQDADTAAVEAIPGVAAVIRDGNFLAVVAQREFQAVKAMQALAQTASWTESDKLPDINDMPRALQALESEVGTVAEAGSPAVAQQGKTYSASFERPYHIHGSIGPSCAVAVMQDQHVTVWTHTQGVYPDREAIAEMLGMPQTQVRCIHAEGSGCYGHNGADDAAGDAALIATKLPGRPIRVQWMREQEHAWEPKGPAMFTKINAALDEQGRISQWNYDLWSNTHSTRPGGAGSLLAGQHKANGKPLPEPKLVIAPSGNGDRNADPLYVLPNKKVLWHFLKDMPVRVSALRALGAYMNVFALESTMDELAILAGADPVEFRLRHLEDERARDVINTAAQKFGWGKGEKAPGTGHGFAFARYKNHAAYLALAIELAVDKTTGRVAVKRAVAAIDSGEAVNPDGIVNNTQGGIIQSMSWTLFEQLRFDRTRVTSIDWASYPILRFASVPEQIEVHIMDRPGEPFLGTGEAAQGPTPAALANAVRDAIGVRITRLPLSRERIRAAIES
jgi:CO/xanthine dehydrogenase Mo-binding subunit